MLFLRTRKAKDSMSRTTEYRCRDCKRITTVLTLGDMYQGCADCGGMKGFDERVAGEKWNEVKKTPKTDKLNKFMEGL